MTKDDNRRTEANGKDYEPIDDPNRGRKRRMKPNPINWLSGDEKKKPVLFAITPPRTGERTMLGVENMLGSIAVPEPFSLELAGDADGVTLLARCLDDQVVRSQIAAHYPQARIIAFDGEVQVAAVLPADAGPKRAEELLGQVAAAYRHYENPAGARFKLGKVKPIVPDPETLHPEGPDCSAGAAS